MHAAGDRADGLQLRGLILVLRRAGLRISKALAVNESDLDPWPRRDPDPPRQGAANDAKWGWTDWPAAARAGIRRRFAPHQLRHAHAVEMSREGVPLLVIQRQLRHYAGDRVKCDRLGCKRVRRRGSGRSSPRRAGGSRLKWIGTVGYRTVSAASISVMNPGLVCSSLNRLGVAVLDHDGGAWDRWPCRRARK